MSDYMLKNTANKTNAVAHYLVTERIK